MIETQHIVYRHTRVTLAVVFALALVAVYLQGKHDGSAAWRQRYEAVTAPASIEPTCDYACKVMRATHNDPFPDAPQ